MTGHPGAGGLREPGGPGEPEDLRERLWSAVRAGDERAASAVVLDAVAAGATVESVLLDVIAAVQRRIGAEWAADRLTVAQEHAATAIHERVIDSLAARHTGPRADDSRAAHVTVVCVDGDWHALPARLLGEVLRGRGWSVDFLGAHVSTPQLVAHLHRTGARAVALSSSFPLHLPTAHGTITACRAAGVPVIAGGAAFGPDGRYARLLGADGWAPDAREAAAVLRKGLERPDRSSVDRAAEALPHLNDREYAEVVGARRHLVRETLRRLEDDFPPLRTYTPERRRRTAEDIAQLVDHLAVALYVADADLFTGFLLWTADVLTARGVPASSMDLALDLLARQLADLPRARRTLGLGRAALREGASARRNPPNASAGAG